MPQDRVPLDAAGGRQDHAGQPPARWPAVPARRLWPLRSARRRVTRGRAARCESTRSPSMRARMCARRLTRSSSDDHAERRRRGRTVSCCVRFRDGSRCCLADISTGSATLQRSPFAALGACGGHPKTRRCARPARWSTGRRRRIAELLTRGSAIVGRRWDQPLPGTTWRRAEGASSADGTRTVRAALPGTPGALGRASPGPARDERGSARSSQGPCASSVRPNPGTPMLAYGWWYARKEPSGVRAGGRARFRPLPRSVRRVVSLDGLPACELLTRAGQ